MLEVHARSGSGGGTGSTGEIQGEKEFFAEMKGEERMVCHFYRSNWPCKVSRHRTVSSAGTQPRFDCL